MAPNEKGMIMMACAEKFGAGAVRNILRHNRREIEHSSNHDIDPKRLERDYLRPFGLMGKTASFPTWWTLPAHFLPAIRC